MLALSNYFPGQWSGKKALTEVGFAIARAEVPSVRSVLHRTWRHLFPLSSETLVFLLTFFVPLEDGESLIPCTTREGKGG